MKITKIMLIAFAFCSLTTTAQEQEDYDCSFYYREALFYLKGDEYTDKNPKKAIEYLKPCAKKGFEKSQLLLGRLYSFENTEDADKKAFKLFKKSAKQGNDIAMADLGIMYKYGRGCKLNFNKARRWFKKSAKLGNDKAAYSLGYLYLKGLGNSTQNYKEAIKWFKKSEHPMAKYWLGVCYYNGYGVEKNKEKANTLLKPASKEVANTIIENNIETEDNIPVINSNTQTNKSYENEDVSEDMLLGKWKGKLLLLDWSKNNINQQKDISLEIKLDADSGALSTVINIDKKLINDHIIKLDNSIYFDTTKLTLPHQTFDVTIPSALSYQLLSGDLQVKSLNGIEYLTITIESYINEWKEKGAPMRFVLTKEIDFENSKNALSNDVLKALSVQKENFIKLYPNPLENDLIISYTLDNPSLVKVQLNDFRGNIIAVLEKEKNQEKGSYRYYFDASQLKTGIYIVSVVANEKRKTRIIVKK